VVGNHAHSVSETSDRLRGSRVCLAAVLGGGLGSLLST
jgi:hypothetical protein